jgi:hypothetical protein
MQTLDAPERFRTMSDRSERIGCSSILRIQARETAGSCPLMPEWIVQERGRFELVWLAFFAYACVMYATAVVEGKVIRFKLSPALAKAHRQNRGNSVTESEAVAFVEAKRRARALRRARPYLASRP